MKTFRLLLLLSLAGSLYLFSSCSAKKPKMESDPPLSPIEESEGIEKSEEKQSDSLDTELPLKEPERGGSTTTENN